MGRGKIYDMKLNNLNNGVMGEALGDEFDPDEALPDTDEFREPSEGMIYAEVPRGGRGHYGRRSGWENALQSSLMWSVKRITKLIKEMFGLDVVFNKEEFGIDSRSGDLVFGWRVMDIRSDADRVKLEAVREWLATDEAVAEVLNLDDFILEPDWKIYEA